MSDPWKRDSKLVYNEGFKLHLSLVLINGTVGRLAAPEIIFITS